MTEQTLKQRHGSKNCAAVVAAMAAGTTIEEFERFIGNDIDYDGHYSDWDFYRFMLHKGYSVGIGIHLSGEEKRGIVMNSDHIQFKLSIYDYPAYVVVESRNWKDVTHAIYWNGNRIYDPDPNIENEDCSLEDYKVIFWYPISKLKK